MLRIAASFFHQSWRGLSTLSDGFGDRVLEPLHAGRRGLGDEHVAEAVDGQSRQTIGFAEHEPIPRLVVEAFAQGQGDLEPVHEQGLVERVLDAATDQARADQRIRIDVADPDRLVAAVDDDAGLARLETAERRTLHVDLVREHPQVPGAQARVFAALEVQRGKLDLFGHVRDSGYSLQDRPFYAVAAKPLRRGAAQAAFLRLRAHRLRPSTAIEKPMAK